MLHKVRSAGSPVLGESVPSLTAAGCASTVNSALAVPVLETIAMVCLPTESVSR